MDLQNIGELHCSICYELFEANLRCPRVLTCGHSFCHSCLENLLIQCPSCPLCKQEILFPNVVSIPVNYSIKSLSSVSLKQNMELKNKGYCEDHHNYKRFRCMDCKCWACGDCVVLSHKTCQTLLVAESLKEMKNEISQEVKAEIEKQKSKCQGIDKHLKDLENKKSSLEKEIKQQQIELTRKNESLKSLDQNIEKLQLLKSECEENCERIKLLESSVIISANDKQFINATSKLNEFIDQAQKLLGNLKLTKHYYGHLTIEVLKDWCLEKSVYALHSENGSNLYGMVDVKGDRVWIHYFVSQRPRSEDVVIPFAELLTTFNGSSELPKRGFIQIDDGSSSVSDVIIATDALTPRAMNFLLLCAGIKGRSYEGEHLENIGRSIGVSYFEGEGEAVAEGISDEGVYEAPQKKGFVCGRWAEFKDSLSIFVIWMKDETEGKLDTKFGFVEEGIEVCDRIYSNKKAVAIKGCGLVI